MFSKRPTPFIRIIFIGCLVLLSSCTTVPVNQKMTGPDEKLQTQKTLFQQAKNFFQVKQYSQAVAILLPLAQQGHLESQYAVGYMYHYGYGLPRNEKESTRWIATAAARGHAKAQKALQIINAAHDLGNKH